MKLVTWVVLFAVAFIIALALVLTFMQPAFKQEVGAQLLTVKTRPLPVYIYVLGAFIFGLGLSSVAAIVGFVRAKAQSFRSNRRISELERELAETKRALTAHESVSSLSHAPEDRSGATEKGAGAA